jgi:hypothetical protein
MQDRLARGNGGHFEAPSGDISTLLKRRHFYFAATYPDDFVSDDSVSKGKGEMSAELPSHYLVGRTDTTIRLRLSLRQWQASENFQTLVTQLPKDSRS